MAFIWNYLPIFLCFIAGECHRSVNIYYLERAINIWDSVNFLFHNQDLFKNKINCVTLDSWCRRCLRILVIRVFLPLNTSIFYFFGANIGRKFHLHTRWNCLRSYDLGNILEVNLHTFISDAHLHLVWAGAELHPGLHMWKSIMQFGSCNRHHNIFIAVHSRWVCVRARRLTVEIGVSWLGNRKMNDTCGE